MVGPDGSKSFVYSNKTGKKIDHVFLNTYLNFHAINLPHFSRQTFI